MDANDLEDLVKVFKGIYYKQLGEEFPQDPKEQLLDAIANYNAVVADEIVCVFDAYEQSGIEREYIYHGVFVLIYLF